VSRQTRTSVRGRTQVDAQTRAASYDVQAPMEVVARRDDRADSFLHLAKALGVGAEAYGQAREKEDKEGYEQGQADAALNKIDQERLARQEKYADGVEAAHASLSVQRLFNELEEQAGDLDADMGVDEKVAWLDAKLGEELGPLVGDPKVRKVIAPMVVDYVQKFAGRETEVARRLNAEASAEALQGSVLRAIDGGPEDFGEWVNTTAETFPGGRSQAWEVITETLATEAERRADPTILALVPTSYSAEDGSIVRPGQTAKVSARFQLAQDRIERTLREQEKPAREWQYAEAVRPFEDRILQGVRISLPEVQPLVKRGIISGEQATSLVNRSEAEYAQRHKADAEQDALDELFLTAGGKSWIDTEGLQGGSKNREQSQKLTNGSVQRMLTGYAVSNGMDPSEAPVTGQALNAALKDPQKAAVTFAVLEKGNDFRLPYGPLKSYMDSITPTMGGTVLERLDLYRAMKERGVDTLYVDEKQAALFEEALTAQRAGEKPEAISAALQRQADPNTVRHVRETLQDRKFVGRLVSSEVSVMGDWFDTDLKEVSNLPLVEARLKSLAEVYLARGLSEDAAISNAQQRFAATHTAYSVNGRTVVVPNPPGVDPSALKQAFDFFSGGAQAFAQANGGIHPEGASLRVLPGVNGKGITAFYVDGDGGQLGPELGIADMIRVAREANPKVFDAALEEARTKAARRRYDYQRLQDKATGRDISIQPKL
jgi:hypothetical protein